MQKTILLGLVVLFLSGLFFFKKNNKKQTAESFKKLHEQMMVHRADSLNRINRLRKPPVVRTFNNTKEERDFVFKMMKKHKKQIYQAIIKNIQRARAEKNMQSLPYEERKKIIKHTIEKIKQFFVEAFLEKKGGSMEDLHKINIKQKEESYYGAREKSEKRKRIENYKFLSQSARSVQKEERNKYVRELMENRRLKALRLEGHNVREFFC